MVSLSMAAELRALERPDVDAADVPDVQLLSDLAIGELSEKPLVLQSEVCTRVVDAQAGPATALVVLCRHGPGAVRTALLTSRVRASHAQLALKMVEAELPRLQLSSPLAHKAAEKVDELEYLHGVLQAEGMAGLRAAIKALELRKLHRILMEEGLPGLRAATRASVQAKKAAKAKVREVGRRRRMRA
jgi:hypothetical protein